MEIATQLALMAKAKKVFGTEQTFLSFPVTLLPFTKQQLNFLADFNIPNLQTFSLLVNQIPTGEAWLPTDQHYLWDAYNEILEQGDFALSVRTAAEETEYQRARSVYRSIRPDGSEEDTAMYRTYKQYKDAFLLAQQTYLAAKTTAEYSTDVAVRQQWQTVDEPRLRNDLTSCEKLWTVEGHKNEIEAAQNTVFALSSKSPVATQQEWKSRFSKDLDTLTDAASLLSVYPSSFSPSNALEEGSWQPFKLTADEAKALVAQAPEELRNRLEVGVGDTDLVSLSFEFSSATVLRPWLATDAFKSRFWRFSEATQGLSNGASPPAGTCPAYVTAIVFARNLTITRQASAPDNKTDLAHQATPLPDFQFPIMVQAVQQPQVIRQPGIEKVKFNPKFQAMGRVMPLMQPIEASSTFNRPALNLTASNLTIRSKPQNFNASMVRRIELDPDMQQVVREDRPAQRVINQKVFRAIEGSTFDRLDPVVLQGGFGTGTATPPPPPPPSTEVDPNIYIFAFICKQLPQCPNPDPNLQW
ncbi:MAG: hypothetical protein KME47_25975 [Nodosilinea sp. WJT8-NPBG4]|nr:hypothetical protein [Nodosilinea sp. WJT8-NPBG4]